MEYLLNAEAHGISYFEYTPILRITRALDEIRAPLVDAILSLDAARLDAYDPTEDIAYMLPDLISSDEDDEYFE